MHPDISEIDCPLAHRLHLIHRVALLRNIDDMNTKKTQARYKKDYDRHVHFEPSFAVNHYLFLENHPLMASDVDRMAFKGYSKLLPCRLKP